MRQEISAVAPGTPPSARVNLLPPHITAKRKLQTLQRLLLLVILAAFVASAAGVWWTSQIKISAEQDLADAQAEMQRLLAAQAEYSEVPQILGDLDTVRAARDLGMGTEILWADHVNAIAAVLPDNMTLKQLAIFTPPRFQSELISSIVPAQIVAATITFTAHAEVLAPHFEWLDELEALPGFIDSYYTAAVIDEEEGTEFYEINAQIALTDDAFALQFGETTEDPQTAASAHKDANKQDGES